MSENQNAEIDRPNTPEVDQPDLPEFERATEHPEGDNTRMMSEKIRDPNADAMDP